MPAQLLHLEFNEILMRMQAPATMGLEPPAPNAHHFDGHRDNGRGPPSDGQRAYEGPLVGQPCPPTWAGPAFSRPFLDRDATSDGLDGDFSACAASYGWLPGPPLLEHR